MNINYGGSPYRDGNYDYQLYMARNNEKHALKRNAMFLGILLLAYEILIYVSGYLFYYIYADIATGSFVWKWSDIRDYFLSHPELNGSTTFEMLYSSVVIVLSFMLLMIIARFCFKINLKHIYRFEKGQGKTAAVCFPPVMLLNLLISLVIGILYSVLGANGITVPDADFSYSDASASAFFFQLLYGVIIAPIVEESIYRGLAIHLLKPYGKKMAVILSALIFGLMHGNIAQATNGFIFGLVMGTITVNCNSIIPTIMIHIMNNSLAEIPDIADIVPRGGDVVYDIYLAMAIAMLVFGTLVIFACYRKVRLPKDENCVLSSSERYKTAMLNLPMIAYWCFIGYGFVKSFIDANF